jgi:chemotaxis protein CheD
MRAGDLEDLRGLRAVPEEPEVKLILEPGHLLVSGASLAVGAVVASALVVTVYDPELRRGGLCHFLLPRPPPGRDGSPIYGASAVGALLRAFLKEGSPARRLSASLVGAACPSWADREQQELVAGNLEVARSTIAGAGVPICDEDVGGTRGRKLCFLTSLNQLLVFKTDAIRRADWFPPPPRTGPEEARP